MKSLEQQKKGRGNRRNGFLCVPHFLLDDLYSDDPVRRSKASVSLCFLKYVYFADGMIVVNRRRMTCRKGEWITSVRQLEQKTGIPRTTLGRVLKRLAEEGDFEIRHEGRFTFVRSLRMETQKEGTEAPQKGASLPGEADLRADSVERPNYKRFKDGRS